MFKSLNERVVRLLLAGAAAIIFLLGFLVCADIFGRALFNSPVKGTPEMVSMAIVIICFLLAGYAVQSGGMIYTDVISGIFGVRGRAARAGLAGAQHCRSRLGAGGGELCPARGERDDCPDHGQSRGRRRARGV